MRISLLDPKWKEQKEAMLSKIKDTTKAGDDEITRNLIGLAKTRPDIFGKWTEGEVTSLPRHTVLMGGLVLMWCLVAFVTHRREGKLCQ
jgi:splicing factor 3A subunit 1